MPPPLATRKYTHEKKVGVHVFLPFATRISHRVLTRMSAYAYAYMYSYIFMYEYKRGRGSAANASQRERDARQC